MLPILLPKWISGGQTGVDQTMLHVMARNGMITGGTAPKGWRTDEGPAPWLADFGLVESYDAGYTVRTLKNVRDADLTIWFGNVLSPGGQQTKKTAFAEMNRREYHFLENPDDCQILVYLGSFFKVNIVNVAGNRLRTNPDAAATAKRVLTDVCTKLLAAADRAGRI